MKTERVVHISTYFTVRIPTSISSSLLIDSSILPQKYLNSHFYGSSGIRWFLLTGHPGATAHLITPSSASRSQVPSYHISLLHSIADFSVHSFSLVFYNITNEDGRKYETNDRHLPSRSGHVHSRSQLFSHCLPARQLNLMGI